MSTPFLNVIRFESRESTITRIVCSRSQVGRIIGKRGLTVRGIQLYANVTIDIDQSHEPAEVLITGESSSAVTLAACIVVDVILGKFKGFSLPREISNAQRDTGDLCRLQILYQPGVGLIPSRCSQG
jgi:rRNA processing protein Krr1/Pno1